jgi:hypothetical protein
MPSGRTEPGRDDAPLICRNLFVYKRVSLKTDFG